LYNNINILKIGQNSNFLVSIEYLRTVQNMQRYFIEIMYDGANYHGWQVQPNSITVQEQLEKAISTILGQKIGVMGAGRTDTGVHAQQFFAHFDTEISNLDSNIVYRLNSFLPDDISVKSIFRVRPDAHSRFDATSRTYEYIIYKSKNPFYEGRAFFLHKSLDINQMNLAAKCLFDYTDFTSFSKLHTQTKTNNCAIQKAVWEQKGDTLIFTIQADRFLRNMVRAIVGTLLEVGQSRMSINEFIKVIESKDRAIAGASVPAHALYLTKVDYPNDIRL
jgi:tRNA pseudouridine38-40 synthase